MTPSTKREGPSEVERDMLKMFRLGMPVDFRDPPSQEPPASDEAAQKPSKVKKNETP